MSWEIVVANTTSGTPMAITGTPSVSRSSPVRLLPTPAPGLMPVSVSCTVVLMRAARREASESTAMTRSGLQCSTTPRTISIVSTPVTPSTPGATALTARTGPGSASGRYCLMCRVT